MCALELLRRTQPAVLGGERFAVGLWVGASATSNTMVQVGVIQRAFGRHDIGNIEAHTDAAAAEGAGAMGAQAFATGDHVAFASSPDLHTAAHEAAHVVQQHAGVHLKGGVGEISPSTRM
jgi:hypothetical protein